MDNDNSVLNIAQEQLDEIVEQLKSVQNQSKKTETALLTKIAESEEKIATLQMEKETTDKYKFIIKHKK